LVERGARWCDSPREVASEAEVVFLMLGYPVDVRETVLGEDGILEVLKPGSLLIDMTTSEPALAVEIHAAASAKGVDALDAPVSGGDVGARNATLVIMVGGGLERSSVPRRCSRCSVIRSSGKATRAPGSTPRWSTRWRSRRG
jgi:3-hydroxyisobutyrate dehydrogenase